MLKYIDLTQEQKDFITNGCGGKGGLIKPPNFIFKASCNPHDFYYWRGCDEAQRKISDDKFYELMKEDIAEAKWYLRPHYHIWAYTYYKFVRLGGKKYFYYGDKNTFYHLILQIYSMCMPRYDKFVRLGGKKYFYYGDKMKTMLDLENEMILVGV